MKSLYKAVAGETLRLARMSAYIINAAEALEEQLKPIMAIESDLTLEFSYTHSWQSKPSFILNGVGSRFAYYRENHDDPAQIIGNFEPGAGEVMQLEPEIVEALNDLIARGVLRIERQSAMGWSQLREQLKDYAPEGYLYGFAGLIHIVQ